MDNWIARFLTEHTTILPGRPRSVDQCSSPKTLRNGRFTDQIVHNESPIDLEYDILDPLLEEAKMLGDDWTNVLNSYN